MFTLSYKILQTLEYQYLSIRQAEQQKNIFQQDLFFSRPFKYCSHPISALFYNHCRIPTSGLSTNRCININMNVD